MKLTELKIGEPARRALMRFQIDTIEKCAGLTKKEISNLHGVGPKVIRLIEEELLKMKLEYKMDKK